MKLANLDGRATLLVGAGGVDIARASAGRFGPSFSDLYRRWDEFSAFAPVLADAELHPVDPASLRSPVPAPRQVFAVGLNYHAHAQETGMALPEVPAVFTKFPASLSGPFDDIPLSGETVDWEVELVVVMGRRADRVEPEDAWGAVAGLTVGQDITDRTLQFAAAGQFSMGKSYRGFGPVGPWLVTPDEVPDPDRIPLRCSIDGVTVQESDTSDMVFGVSQLIAFLSSICPVLPGDVIFTGTPAGTGIGATPPRFLQAGEVLESTIDGIGTIRNRVVTPG